MLSYSFSFSAFSLFRPLDFSASSPLAVSSARAGPRRVGGGLWRGRERSSGGTLFPSSCGSVSRFSPSDKPHLSLPLFSLPPHQTFLLFFLPTRLILARLKCIVRVRSARVRLFHSSIPYLLLLWTVLIASQHEHILGLPRVRRRLHSCKLLSTLRESKGSRRRQAHLARENDGPSLPVPFCVSSRPWK